MKQKSLKYVISETVKLYFDLRIYGSAAELSYYFLFSFFPILMVINAAVGMVGIDSKGIDVMLSNAYLLPEQVRSLISTFISYISRQDHISSLILGVFLTVTSVSRYINSIRNHILSLYSSESKRGAFAKWGISVIFAFLMIFSFYLTLAFLMIGENILNYVGEYFKLAPKLIELWLFLRFVIIALYIFALLVSVYYVMPEVSHRLKNVITGASFSVASWIFISVFFSYYIDNISKYTLIYGSIGAFIVLLLWIYLTNNLLLLGAAINSVIFCKDKNALKTEPSDYKIVGKFK